MCHQCPLPFPIPDRTREALKDTTYRSTQAGALNLLKDIQSIKRTKAALFSGAVRFPREIQHQNFRNATYAQAEQIIGEASLWLNTDCLCCTE